MQSTLAKICLKCFCNAVTRPSFPRTPLFHAAVMPRRFKHGLYSNNVPPPTIYALSSSPGKAGVAVIRVSGSNARRAVESMANIPNLKARHAFFRKIHHPLTKEALDRGLLLWFPGPNSFTGEDIVEFHVHGGNAVVRSMLDALGSLEGFRMAEQGEFARRAFDNDKADLTELEGLADLLNAETEAQRQLALRQAEGGLRKPYEKWRSRIIECMATTEAVIDFGEDENIDEGALKKVFQEVQQLHSDISTHLNDSRVGEIVRNGLRVAILGPPNAGKSTLLNLLAAREAAIVSDIPGTTRDIVEVSLNLGGYPVILSDTAGIRESQDAIEMEGVKRALKRSEISDIKICLLPLSDDLHIDPALKQVLDQDTLLILTKKDLVSRPVDDDTLKSIQQQTGARRVWAISCKTGQGVSQFLQDMIDMLKQTFDKAASSPAIITQARHRYHLEQCLNSLQTFLDMPTNDVVLAAEELRQAANSIGRITGRVDVEDVLDVLFSQFCIGK